MEYAAIEFMEMRMKNSNNPDRVFETLSIEEYLPSRTHNHQASIFQRHTYPYSLPQNPSRITQTINCICLSLIKTVEPKNISYLLEYILDGLTPNLDSFYSPFRIKLLYVLSNSYYLQKDYRQSLIISKMALIACKPYICLCEAFIYYHIGISHFFLGQTAEGVRNMIMGVEILKEAGREDLIKLFLMECEHMGLSDIIRSYR